MIALFWLMTVIVYVSPHSSSYKDQVFS